MELETWLNKIAKQKAARVAILTHDNPDPDALASCMAASYLLQHLGADVTIFFGGQLTHTQNRVIFNRFDLQSEMTWINGDDDQRSEVTSVLEKNKILIVDSPHLPGRGNMKTFEGMVDLNKQFAIIDHHMPVGDDPATYHHENVGACSTIFYKIFKEREIEINRKLATAMLIGIESDTDTLRGESTTDDDRNAADDLRDICDPKSYMAIVNYPKPRKLIELKKAAYSSCIQDGDLVVAGVGFIKQSHQALLGTIADEFMNYDTIAHACIIGIIDDGNATEKYLTVSMRTSGDVINADELIRQVFGNGFGGRKGAAGGSAELGAVWSLMLDCLDREQIDTTFHNIFTAFATKFIELKNRVS